MRKLIYLSIVCLTSCAQDSIPTIPTMTSSVLAVSVPKATPTEEEIVVRPTPGPTETPAPKPTEVPCPAHVDPPEWILPNTATLSGYAHLYCQAPRNATDECFSGVVYFWTHSIPDGYYSFGPGRQDIIHGIWVDTTVFPNGDYIFFCSLMRYNGLNEPNSSELHVTIQN